MKNFLFTLLGVNLIGIGYGMAGDSVGHFIMGVLMQTAGLFALEAARD